jgi:hypothetical protein
LSGSFAVFAICVEIPVHSLLHVVVSAEIEIETSLLLPIVAGTLILLLFAMLLVMLRIGSRVKWIEARIRESQRPVDSLVIEPKKEKLKSEQSEFDEFIREDGSRLTLTKREQSAAFREWRRQRGVTWGTDE